jgi:hypothetical protein
MAERFSTPLVFALPVRNPPRVALSLSIHLAVGLHGRAALTVRYGRAVSTAEPME